QYQTTHYVFLFFFSSRRRHTRFSRDWSSDVCSSDLTELKTNTLFPTGTSMVYRPLSFVLVPIVVPLISTLIPERGVPASLLTRPRIILVCWIALSSISF